MRIGKEGGREGESVSVNAKEFLCSRYMCVRVCSRLYSRVFVRVHVRLRNNMIVVSVYPTYQPQEDISRFHEGGGLSGRIVVGA